MTQTSGVLTSGWTPPVARLRPAVPLSAQPEVGAAYERLIRAYRALSPEAAAALYDAEALAVTEETGELRGRDAIREWFADLFGKARARGIDLDISFVVGERGVQNGVVSDVGTYLLTGRRVGDVSRIPMRKGRFLAVFRRATDGRCRIVRFSTALPPV